MRLDVFLGLDSERPWAGRSHRVLDPLTNGRFQHKDEVLEQSLVEGDRMILGKTAPESFSRSGDHTLSAACADISQLG